MPISKAKLIGKLKKLKLKYFLNLIRKMWVQIEKRNEKNKTSICGCQWFAGFRLANIITAKDIVYRSIKKKKSHEWLEFAFEFEYKSHIQQTKAEFIRFGFPHEQKCEIVNSLKLDLCE